MMRQLKAAALVLLLYLPACATRGSDHPQAAIPAGGYGATPYYVEFHSRPSLVSGHTYIVYGAQDQNGKSIDRTVTGFVPIGGVVGLLGGIIAAPGRIEKSYLDERLPDMNNYKANLTPAQYGELTHYIAEEQGKTKIWNLFLNNCNDFAAGAAQAAGLKVPSDRYVPPALFIMTLSNLNA